MFRKISMIAMFAVASVSTSHLAHAQFGGIRVQVGGYSNGMRVGAYNYGNGYYNTNGNIYLNGYGNQYYGNPYYNVFNGGYNNGQPYTGLYPNFGSSYVTPYYVAPRPYAYRRFRYR